MTDFRNVLSAEDIARYKQAGYTDDVIQQAVDEIEAEAPNTALQKSYQKAQQQKMMDPRSKASQSFIAGMPSENLIQWQLELDSILERIEHMLRGDRPRWVNGSTIWEPPTPGEEISYKELLTPQEIEQHLLEGLTEEELQKTFGKRKGDERIFNEFGVAEIMRILSNYVNRNTILSHYKEEVINEKMLDLGFDISDLIFLKYEDMGLDTLAKRKLYPIIVRELVDVVHSSYLRALNGGERESLREARSVTQTEPLNMPGGININTGMQRQERGLLNPMRWIGGKFK